MPREPRITGPTLKVLGALLASGRLELSGSEIGSATKLPSGTLYPILFRLENAGWLQSRWEEEDPKTLGRPRRRFYQVTATGTKAAQREFQEIVAVAGSWVAWA